jgi:hypothetical protein
LGTAVINGLLAWATVVSGGTALGGGLVAAMLALDMTRPDVRADLINRGIGFGFMLGAAFGFLTFVVFAARLMS